MGKTLSFSILVVLFFGSPGAASAQEATADTRQLLNDYKEVGQWKIWSDGRLKFRIPSNWKVAIEAKSISEKGKSKPLQGFMEDESWRYLLINGKQVEIEITVKRGGPEFIDCFCAPKDKYQLTKKNGVKIWTISMADGRIHTRKMATGAMRMDIHQRMPEHNAELITHVINSTGLVDPKTEK